MKLLLLIFSAVLLLASLSACKNDDDSPQTPNYGAEYFECKVNGEDFVPQGIPFACDPFLFNYYPEPYLGSNAGYTIIRGLNCFTDQSVGIRVYGLVPSEGILDFVNPIIADSVSPYQGFFNWSDSTLTTIECLVDGQMVIEHFIPREPGANTPSGSIKGTFNFSVTDSLNTDTFHITDGRFRFNVPQVF